MPDSNKQLRQYAGLVIVIVSFLGGIVGWGWAAYTVESSPSSPDSTETRVESSPGTDTDGRSSTAP